MSWKKEDMDRLIELKDQGLSAAQISRALGGGISRNAVIGKLHRMGLSCLGGVSGSRAQSASPRPIIKKSRAPKLVKEKPILRMADEPVSILDLNGSICRFPIGDPKEDDFRFCGAVLGTQSDGKKYCPAHNAIACASSRMTSKEISMMTALPNRVEDRVPNRVEGRVEEKITKRKAS